MTHRDQINAILSQVTPWPQEDRVALAYQILHDMRKKTREPAPRHTASRAAGIAQGNAAPPDDATVQRWLDERRTQKYG